MLRRRTITIEIAEYVKEPIRIFDQFRKLVQTINTDEIPYSPKIKKRIREEFSQVLRLLDFTNKAHDVFRRWYIDGRIYFHKIIDEEDPQQGIQELRYIDALKIKRIRKIEKAETKKKNSELLRLEKSHDLWDDEENNERIISLPA